MKELNKNSKHDIALREQLDCLCLRVVKGNNNEPQDGPFLYVEL